VLFSWLAIRSARRLDTLSNNGADLMVKMTDNLFANG